MITVTRAAGDAAGQTMVAGEAWWALYGAPDGTWLRVQGAGGWQPPPKLEGLAHLGAPAEVIRGVYDELRTRFAGAGTRYISGGPWPAQAGVANIIRVRQPSVGRYLAGSTEPQLPPEGWRRLVLAHHGELSYWCSRCGLTSCGGDALRDGRCGHCQDWTALWSSRRDDLAPR